MRNTAERVLEEEIDLDAIDHAIERIKGAPENKRIDPRDFKENEKYDPGNADGKWIYTWPKAMTRGDAEQVEITKKIFSKRQRAYRRKN